MDIARMRLVQAQTQKDLACIVKQRNELPWRTWDKYKVVGAPHLLGRESIAEFNGLS